ncbi:unnamed protein product [Boreogadus saida]
MSCTLRRLCDVSHLSSQPPGQASLDRRREIVREEVMPGQGEPDLVLVAEEYRKEEGARPRVSGVGARPDKKNNVRRSIDRTACEVPVSK